ncbi:putative Proteasome subunit alpha type-2-like 15, partial [Homarus americanus]
RMMVKTGYQMAVLVIMVINAATVVSQNLEVDVGLIVNQVVEHHLTGCHLVLITTTQHSRLFSRIIRHMSVGVEAGVVVEAGSVFSENQLTQDHLLRGLWRDTRTTCHGLILDLTTTTSNNTNFIFRLTEASSLWKFSEMRVVLVGGKAGMKDVLLHHGLRNTVHVLYLAITDLTLHTPPWHTNSRLRKVLPQEGIVSERVWVYRRCLYCNNGEMDVQLILQKNLTSLIQQPAHLFPEQFHNLMGYKYRVVALRYFPYMDYERDRDEPGTTVTPKDSLDREESDFCMIAAPTPERLQVIDYTKGYTPDVMITLSLKPTLLPENLSLIRPFEGELWVALLLSVVAFGVLMWVLQKVWLWAAGGRSVKFNTAFLYGWGALLEKPPPVPSVTVSGQVNITLTSILIFF